MKKIKYILFSAVILSFVFITACSTTKSVPQDDVYYSTTPHNNVTAKATTVKAVSSSVVAKQQKIKQADNAEYRQGKVENISQPTGQTTSGDTYDVNYSSQLKKFHQSNDTILNNNDNQYTDRAVQDSSRQSKTTTIVAPNVTYNLGFGSPYFGSSWSFGFGSNYGWNMGLGYGWGFPSYGWGYPGYGWGYSGYGWGYPGYGWGYPGYGWGGGYYDLGYSGWGGGYYSPYYTGWGGGYYSPYYPGYSDNGRRGRGIYQPRINRGGGTSVPRSSTTGGSGVYTNHGAKSAIRHAGAPGTVSRKRVPVNPGDRNGKMMKPNSSNRPAGSMRYNAALAKKRLKDMQGRLNKPGGSAVRKSPDGSRSSKFGISESRNRAAEGYRKPPAYRQEENMPKPRFQKPKQYQSLESRSTRSSKEFYRAPARTSNPEYRRSGTRTGTRTVYPRQQTVRRQNVYRSAGPRNSVYRSRRTRSGVRINNTPSRSFFSPNNFRAPVRRNSSISRPTRSFSAPTRSFSAPSRPRTTSGSGGGIRRGSGSGGIRR